MSSARQGLLQLPDQKNQASGDGIAIDAEPNRLERNAYFQADSDHIANVSLDRAQEVACKRVLE